MRKILCASCGAERGLDGREGTRLAYAASIEGPAEYERVTWGAARTPKPEQRHIDVTAVDGSGASETTVVEAVN